MTFDGLIADKAFDANWIVAELNERGAKVVISQRPKRVAPLAIDLDVYKGRHLIENFFCKLKEFKRVAMRSDKTDTSFKAMIYLGAASLTRADSQQALEQQAALGRAAMVTVTSSRVNAPASQDNDRPELSCRDASWNVDINVPCPI